MSVSADSSAGKTASVLVLIRGREYLRPYLVRAFGPGYELTFAWEIPTDMDFDMRVAIAGEGETLPEGAGDLPVIEVPEIVCTGMQGTVRELAGDVASGRFFAIRDFSYPHIRVVHGTDVAEAARIAAEAGRPGRWALDDGETPTLNELADALAFRMKGKRLYALPRKWAALFRVGLRWKRFPEATAPDSPRFDEAFGFAPTPVCRYLRTHVYDESSL